MQPRSESLLEAAKRGETAIVKSLLEEGADIEARDNDNNTVLMWAAYEGHQDTVALLLANGADIEARNNSNNTALMLAAYQGHQDTVALLLEKGANIEARNNDNDTALMLAAYQGHQDTVALLLANGATIEAKDSDNDTALMLAAYQGHQDTVALLLANGATIEAKNNDNNTALTLAINKRHHGVMSVFLEKCPALLNKKGQKGYTPLHYAAHFNNQEAAVMLLTAGALKNIKNEYGQTAEALAKEKGNAELAETIRLYNSFESRLTTLESAGIKVIVREEYLCPISYTIMNDPITVSSGITYDRLSLEQYFAAKQNPQSLPCSATREIILQSELNNKTNVTIKNLIDNFLTKMEEEWKQSKNKVSVVNANTLFAADPTGSNNGNSGRDEAKLLNKKKAGDR